jgi:hypothetical protein
MEDVRNAIAELEAGAALAAPSRRAGQRAGRVLTPCTPG